MKIEEKVGCKGVAQENLGGCVMELFIDYGSNYITVCMPKTDRPLPHKEWILLYVNSKKVGHTQPILAAM